MGAMERIKNKLPEKLMFIFRIIKIFRIIFSNYFYDIKRYIAYSTTARKPNDFHQLQSRIMASYHVLEKGLAMPDRRLNFGQGNVQYLISLLKQYIHKNYPTDDLQFTSALAALKSYATIHKKQNIKIDVIDKNIEDLINQGHRNIGYISRTSEEVNKLAKGSFKDLINSRHSLRNFSDEEVDIKTLEEAIKLAQRSPSVCNRQSSKIYIISNTELIKKCLECQNGNRGFGHLINKLILVTSSLKSFNGISERNQSFIDGGIYSMSLLYSLHYLGLGACPLNWSANFERDKKLREVIDIDAEDNIIMMIGVGHLPKKFNVAYSERRPINQVIRKIY